MEESKSSIGKDQRGQREKIVLGYERKDDKEQQTA
jgi:hypothetical protein